MEGGQSVAALPRCSDVDLLGDRERIVDLDAEVPDRALHLGVAKEQLDRAEVPGSPIDQGRLSSTQRMSAEQRRGETDAGDPLRQQPGILAGGEATTLAATATKQKIAGSLLGRRNVLIDRLARLLGDLEPDRKLGLVLPNGRPVDRRAMRRDILDSKAHQVAATQLAIDREIEERQISRAPCELQSSSNGPDVLRLQRWFRSDELKELRHDRGRFAAAIGDKSVRSGLTSLGRRSEPG
jgi:hypothetical protein